MYYTFCDLHAAIQDAFGWSEAHLHGFVFGDLRRGTDRHIGTPMPEDPPEGEMLPEWKERIADWFTNPGTKCVYTYDFGDTWEHAVALERIIQREKGVKCPRCTGGKRSCPPEDCGGPWGYKDFLAAIQDPKHPEHEDMKGWVGRDFDPEAFDAKKINFTDPEERLAQMQEMRKLMSF